MRWTKKTPKDGDMRVKKTLALLPIRIGNEVRWFELVRIKQVTKIVRSSTRGLNYRHRYWFDLEFLARQNEALSSLVMPRQLKFPLETMRGTKSSVISRWIARCTAAKILNGDCGFYQFGGSIGALYPNSYETVKARKEQLAQWVLYDAGYSVCAGDLMELTGYDPESLA